MISNVIYPLSFQLLELILGLRNHFFLLVPTRINLLKNTKKKRNLPTSLMLIKQGSILPSKILILVVTFDKSKCKSKDKLAILPSYKVLRYLIR